MTLIPSLPMLDVYVAFNPTEGGTQLLTSPTQALPASGASNSYWTNCSQYLRSFNTNSGRQHFLDRVEAGTISLTMNNRDGFFFNGTTNGTTYVIQARQPIAVTGTWLGVTYPIFWGLIDSATEVITDQQNSDLTIQASDLMKQLSLKYVSSTSFWETYAQSTSAAHWYRCDFTNTAVVTNATGNGTTVKYTGFNNFVAGQNVTITGLGIESGVTLNLKNVVIASVASDFSSFSVTNAATGVSNGTGSAYRTIVIDEIGSSSFDGNYIGSVSFPSYGAMIYDNDTCVDLGNGANGGGAGYIRLPQWSSTMGGIDLWVLGQGMGGSVITIVMSGGYTIVLGCTGDGFLTASYSGTGTGSVNSPAIINDGYWHHVGLVDDSSGHLHLYCDGTFTSLGITATGFTTSLNMEIGGTSAFVGLAAQVDEIVISNTSSLSTLADEVRSRYTAGILLQLPINPQQNPVSSGDRIAEILTVAGFGTIVNGAITLNTNSYFINNSGTAWVQNTSGNGFINTGPFYWDTPVTTSTALDLIGEVTDTDIGSFFQKPDGTFAFYNQLFYGTWAWGGSSGTWTQASYSIPTDHVWTDDSSGYAYDPTSCQPIRDDADLWTQVQVTPQAGTMQIYENVGAEDLYGFSVLTKTSTLHPTLNLALSTANFLGYLFRSPLPRVNSVKLLSVAENGGYMTAILGAGLGDPVTFKRTPPGASTSGTYPASRGQINATMIIESRQLEFQSEPGTLNMTALLDPYPVRA